MFPVRDEKAKLPGYRMLIDCHVHIAAEGSGFPGNHLSRAFRRSLAYRIMRRQYALPEGGRDLDGRIRSRLMNWIAGSRLDRVVLLALDFVHGEDGRRDPARTLAAVDNDYVAGLAKEHPKVLFGASVHPYRRDALAELDRVAEEGACLVKWLPSAQSIRPDDPRCLPFYERLAELSLPLLCHTGPEHTLRLSPAAFNDPRRLLPALERGVTVIAAHCGSRLFLHERSWFGVWRRMALRHPNLYGDLSAFIACTRMPALLGLRGSPALSAKLLYGSDFPAPVLPSNLLGAYGWGDYARLRRIQNPLDRSLETVLATGMPAEVFSRASGLLRLAR